MLCTGIDNLRLFCYNKLCGTLVCIPKPTASERQEYMSTSFVAMAIIVSTGFICCPGVALIAYLVAQARPRNSLNCHRLSFRQSTVASVMLVLSATWFSYAGTNVTLAILPGDSTTNLASIYATGFVATIYWLAGIILVTVSSFCVVKVSENQP